MADVTAQDLLAMVTTRFEAERNGFRSGMVVAEVSLTSPEGITSRADALAVGFTQAQGRVLEGIEIKVSRSDLLAELNHPEKSEVWARHCARWWLVAPPEIAELDELPPSWGWLVPTKGGKLRIRRRAETSPNTPSWAAAMAILTSVNSMQSRLLNERWRREQAERQAGYARDEMKSMREEQARVHEDAQHLEDLRQVATELGVELEYRKWIADGIDRITAGNLLRVMHAARTGGFNSLTARAHRELEGLQHLRDTATTAAEALESALAKVAAETEDNDG